MLNKLISLLHALYMQYYSWYKNKPPYHLFWMNFLYIRWRSCQHGYLIWIPINSLTKLDSLFIVRIMILKYIYLLKDFFVCTHYCICDICLYAFVRMFILCAINNIKLACKLMKNYWINPFVSNSNFCCTTCNASGICIGLLKTNILQ